MMKYCTACGREKPIDDFYAHRGMADGHLSICKVCKRAQVRAARAARPAHYAAYDHLRNQTPARKAESNDRKRRAYARRTAPEE